MTDLYERVKVGAQRLGVGADECRQFFECELVFVGHRREGDQQALHLFIGARHATSTACSDVEAAR